jgi:hypothetical protein
MFRMTTSIFKAAKELRSTTPFTLLVTIADLIAVIIQKIAAKRLTEIVKYVYIISLSSEPSSQILIEMTYIL